MKGELADMLGILEATETFLRVFASNTLPYSGVIRIERAARQRQREIIERLMAGSDAIPESTDWEEAPQAESDVAEGEASYVSFEGAAGMADVAVSIEVEANEVGEEDVSSFVLFSEPDVAPLDAPFEEDVWAADAASGEPEPSYVQYEEVPIGSAEDEPFADEAEVVADGSAAEMDDLSDLIGGPVSDPETDRESDPDSEVLMAVRVAEQLAIERARAATPVPTPSARPAGMRVAAPPAPTPVPAPPATHPTPVAVPRATPIPGRQPVTASRATPVPASRPTPLPVSRPTPAPPTRIAMGKGTPAPIESRGTEVDVEAFGMDADPYEDRVATPVPTSRAAGPGMPTGRPTRRQPPLAEPSAGPTLRVGAPRTPAPASARATPIGASRVTAGLYGDPTVPRIREGTEVRPRAAAIQLDPKAESALVIGEADEEAIEIGEASDDEGAMDPASDVGGFRLEVQEYETDVAAEAQEAAQTPTPAPAAVTQRAPVAGAQETTAMLYAARAAAESGDMNRAAELFGDLIDLAPGTIDAHIGRGRLYLDLGDFTRAMSDFMASEDIAPDSPEPAIAIGDLFFARKDYRKAISYFDQALEIAPSHAMAWCRRGISHYYRKNHGPALQDLQRAFELNPEIPNIQTYLAMAKKRVGR